MTLRTSRLLSWLRHNLMTVLLAVAVVYIILQKAATPRERIERRYRDLIVSSRPPDRDGHRPEGSREDTKLFAFERLLKGPVSLGDDDPSLIRHLKKVSKA